VKVKDVMAKDPISIDPDAPVGTALEVMRTKRVRHLPVVDEGSRLVGIVTDRDLRQAAFAPVVEEYLSARGQRRMRHMGESLENLRVRDVMTWAVTTTHPESPLAHAALIMSESRVGSLPVVDGGQLVGLLTEHDVLKAVGQRGDVSEFDPEGSLR